MLVVWWFDRSLRDLVEIISSLEGRDVGFRSLNESIDTTSPSGKLVFHLFSALSEFERSLVIARARAGLKAARARGRVGERPHSLSKMNVKKAAAMLKDPEVTKREVAEHFKVSRVTLNQFLKRHG